MPIADEEHPPGRLDHRFFHQDWTKKTIVALAQVDTLIVYCGAGVTIDRTGLSWGELVARLLRNQLIEDGAAQQRLNNETVVDRHLRALRDNFAPLQLASILDQIRTQSAASRESNLYNLVAQLQVLLYRDNGWQSGVLVRNIIRLAVGFVGLGRRAVIVTTNFDDYLERGFTAYCDQTVRHFSASGQVSPSLPGVKISSLGPGGWTRVKDTKGAGQLELIYLHGRIPNGGTPTGQLVLSECDYHATHEKVVKKLRELLAIDESGVLVLGSAGTDPPLLAALAATKDPPNENRYALVPVLSTGMINAGNDDLGDLLGYVGHRGRHFGLKYLTPDFHYQIAQFCEEVLTAVGLSAGPKSYMKTSLNIRYGLRLVAWWERWQESTYGADANAVHAALAKTVVDVRELLAKFRTREHKGDEPEKIKVELWVRSNPKDLRRLCLWGTSAGVLTDRAILRSEELRHGSGNASIRAFIEGQPQYVSRDTLMGEGIGSPPNTPTRSRWCAFLSVPIRVDYSDGTVPEPVGLPVGVITLATMDKIEDSDIPQTSSQNMEELVQILRSVGQILLQA